MTKEGEEMQRIRKVAAILGGAASVGAVAIGGVGLASFGLPPAPAHAVKNGFTSSSTTIICQGNSKDCKTATNTNNNGTVQSTVETTGPKGALKNNNTPDNQVTENTTVCGPGKGKC